MWNSCFSDNLKKINFFYFLWGKNSVNWEVPQASTSKIRQRMLLIMIYSNVAFTYIIINANVRKWQLLSLTRSKCKGYLKTNEPKGSKLIGKKKRKEITNVKFQMMLTKRAKATMFEKSYLEITMEALLFPNKALCWYLSLELEMPLWGTIFCF